MPDTKHPADVHYLIEDDVPIPPKKTGHRRPRSNSLVPVLRSLKVGQSFFAAGVSPVNMTAAARYVEGAKFTTRTDHTGTRVWRIE